MFSSEKILYHLTLCRIIMEPDRDGEGRGKLVIKTVEMHTGGEPVRIIVSGIAT